MEYIIHLVSLGFTSLSTFYREDKRISGKNLMPRCRDNRAIRNKDLYYGQSVTHNTETCSPEVFSINPFQRWFK